MTAAIENKLRQCARLMGLALGLWRLWRGVRVDLMKNVEVMR